MSAIEAAVTLVRGGSTIAQAANKVDVPAADVLQAVMTDYRRLLTRPASANGEARSLDYWLHHPSPKVVTAAEKLRDIHDAEDKRASLLAEKQKLEDQLAKVRAQLGNSGGKGPPREPRPCPHCERILPGPQGLALHIKAKHKETQ